jgi:hypothetical protein
MGAGPVKGNLVTPVSFDPSGILVPLALDADGKVIVTGSVGFMAHNLLDGSVHPDTVIGSPVRGDVITGNATPAWQKLAIGSANSILSCNTTDVLYQTLKTLFNASLAGVAFPGSPTTGDIFFRTDLGFLCFYDGTRWLTCHEYTASVNGLSGSIDASTSFVVHRNDYQTYFTRIGVITRINTTNDVNNYWSVNVYSYNLPGGGASTTILSFNTAADAIAAYVDHSAAPAVNAPVNWGSGRALIAKTLAPGPFALYVTYYFRLIIP